MRAAKLVVSPAAEQCPQGLNIVAEGTRYDFAVGYAAQRRQLPPAAHNFPNRRAKSQKLDEQARCFHVGILRHVMLGEHII
jgi:hypothetical protein